MAENVKKIAHARHTAMGIEYKRSPMDRVFMVLNVTFFILFTILCIFPFYYLFINTISDNDLVNRGVITLLPQGIHIQNYIALKNVSDFGQSVFISVTRTILGTAVMVLASAFAGYLTTKKEMWRRSLWYRLLVITMYFNAGLVPWYLNMLGLGLTDNYLGYIIPGIVQPYNIILVKTYIESIPAELEESATIDPHTHGKHPLPLHPPAQAVRVPQQLLQPCKRDAVRRQRVGGHAEHQGHPVHHLHGDHHPHHVRVPLHAAVL